jgi:hypothetical protein
MHRNLKAYQSPRFTTHRFSDQRVGDGIGQFVGVTWKHELRAMSDSSHL